jgi:aminoglycoside phosphotransferase (APT) family kinase protein
MLFHVPPPFGLTLTSEELVKSGIPPEESFIKSYCERSGLRLTKWNFYLVFSIFRMTGIAQGVYKRFLQVIFEKKLKNY